MKSGSPITAAVITLSDKGSRGERIDQSGPHIATVLINAGMAVKETLILPDEKQMIKDALVRLSGKVDLVITTGGTGLAPRDVTPEATREVIEKEIPGIAEAIRAEGMKKTERAMLTRGIAGMRAGTIIINLPGSLKAVREGMDAIIDAIAHAVEKARGGTGDCAMEADK